MKPILTTVARLWSCVRAFGYDGGMDANAKRPWYRLHWGTVLVVMLAALGWLEVAFSGMSSRLVFGQLDNGLPILDGWPWTCFGGYSEWPPRTQMSISAPIALADVIVLLAFLGSIMFVVERMERATLRVGLSTLFTATAVIAIMLGFWRWDAAQEGLFFDPSLPPSLGQYRRILQTELSGQGIVFFSVGCAAYTVIRVITACFFWAASHRPAPAKVEADGSPAQGCAEPPPTT